MNMNKLYKQLYKYFKIIFTKRMRKICERKRNNNSENANDKVITYTHRHQSAEDGRRAAVTFTYAPVTECVLWWWHKWYMVYGTRNAMPEMNHIKITI